MISNAPTGQDVEENEFIMVQEDKEYDFVISFKKVTKQNIRSKL